MRDFDERIMHKVAELYCQGHTQKGISAELQISKEKVKGYIDAYAEKTGRPLMKTSAIKAEMRKSEVDKLHREGKTLEEIAEILGVSLQLVKADIRAIEYRRRANKNPITRNEIGQFIVDHPAGSIVKVVIEIPIDFNGTVHNTKRSEMVKILRHYRRYCSTSKGNFTYGDLVSANR